ncbi:hypothetical protein LXA43DRAFT_1143106 [Ganoderma leucocontextum]|nr:hypothetical protein LXA43DRAFT_1143106 [Ganoderma leucocontextum]
MTLSDSRIPVPTNKRKRLTDDGADSAEGPQKAALEGTRKQALRIVTDITSDTTIQVKSPTLDELLSSPGSVSAKHTAPSILGLHFDPTLLLPEDLAEDLMLTCIRTFFQEGTGNQVMSLFERAPYESDRYVCHTCTAFRTRVVGLLSLLRGWSSKDVSSMCCFIGMSRIRKGAVDTQSISGNPIITMLAALTYEKATQPPPPSAEDQEGPDGRNHYGRNLDAVVRLLQV